ncbi:MAG: IS30 family transposase [Proteobacteria bacterium]|nr:IS30 family transposase [Pseudomonadota bacterium]
MAQMGRPGLSAAQKRELWQRWKAGQSLSEIGRAFGKHSSSIHLIVSSNGGFLPRVRKRHRTSLTLLEREEISRGIAQGSRLRTIATSLGRAPSTISREVAHSGGASRYRAASADERAWLQARRPQPCLLARSARLRSVVARRLALDWSPEQISGWLARTYPDDKAMHVSTETIYRSLFVQARGVLKKELQTHLRSRRTMRRAKGATGRGHGKGDIVDAVSIRERPAEAADRAVPGHWEGDLIAGTHNSHVATLVERRSRFTMLVKVPGKDTHSVVGALRRRVRTLPKELRLTLTWDRGKELADHKHFTVATDVKVYFCDPSSPWQRGTNENTNGLLRQYLLKDSDLSSHSQAELNAIARRLNTRPRKTLGYRTPAAILERDVALTG